MIAMVWPYEEKGYTRDIEKGIRVKIERKDT
jgi:hypothetical protein